AAPDAAPSPSARAVARDLVPRAHGHRSVDAAVALAGGDDPAGRQRLPPPPARLRARHPGHLGRRRGSLRRGAPGGGARRAHRDHPPAHPAGPALVRLDDQLVAVDADAAVLRDVAGRSRLLHGDRVVIDDRSQGPYRLEAPDGTLLAISP